MMPQQPGPRFPFGRLAAMLGHPTAGDLAVRLGVSHHSVRAARRRGLSVRVADEWAVACGLHPAEVWAEW